MSTQCRQIALVASIRNILTEFDTKLTESPMKCANIVIAHADISNGSLVYASTNDNQI